MGWLLNRALLVVVFVLAGAGVGAIVGNMVGAPQIGPALGAAIGACIHVLADSLRALRLMDWLRGDLEREAPRDRGFWGEAAYRVERALRMRERALTQEQERFAQFMSAIEASPNGVLLLDAADQIQWMNPVAATHHERADGSGYHKCLTALEPGARVVCAADVYVALTSDRADRAAFPAEDAVAGLRRLAAAGALDPEATDAVLAAAGHGGPPAARARRARHPGGLTGREAEVLRLAARGLTTKAIADVLFISPKTAGHHIQHVYTKIGVSTRAAAALWAMQNAIVN